ncbi:MAG: type IV pilus modification protein PilV [Betaproteobacteria bacterium]|nr:MAG: type IV pilus modification protein PilV [Betaproteobacteria bacterium]
MTRLQSSAPRTGQAGFNMLEILFSLLIVTTGLLGLAGTQVVAQRAELESYQRAQAIVLMTDIVDRINTNRKGAICYAVTTDSVAGTKYLGSAGAGKYDISAYSCPAMATNPAAVARTQLDLRFIDQMLLGASETIGGNKVGSMIGARACIGFDTAAQAYTVAVAWQGATSTFSPASWPIANNPALARNCALDLYGTDTQRRVMWTTIMVASLT